MANHINMGLTLMGIDPTRDDHTAEPPCGCFHNEHGKIEGVCEQHMQDRLQDRADYASFYTDENKANHPDTVAFPRRKRSRGVK